ncbi:unnamed protein product [Cochlearia groenlandica]
MRLHRLAVFRTASTTILPLSPGFVLEKGDSRVFTVSTSWQGSFWGRSLCSTSKTGNFSCATGDCGTGKIECNRGFGKPPMTLAEFSFGINNGQDFYDVSLLNGYNLPLVVAPQNPTQSTRSCNVVGCGLNLNKTCPIELKVGTKNPVGCMSACEALNQPKYCCSGEYSSPDKCKPTNYSMVFKRECPLVYTYPSDDASSTFTCVSSSNYVITFCPSIIPNTTK